MKRSGLILFILLVVISLRAQPLSVSSASITGSICYNDGSVTLHVTGGTAPYHYSIISGPTLPNVTYPISPSSGSTFLSLHSGTYTVQITDNNGASILYTFTIPGNYQFPVLTGSVSTDSIFMSPSLGLPPYSFAISTVGPNGPFGAWQSSNVFPALCNGGYYARVIDSCGNFYTTPVISIYRLPISLLAGCIDSGLFNYITADPRTLTGNPPFRFICRTGTYNVTNLTGRFNVPKSFSCPDTILMIDVCNDTAKTIVDCNPLLISFCSNFSDSTGMIVATGGTPPYTYSFFEDINGVWTLSLTQDSGHFTHLPYKNINESVAFQAADACGRISSPAFPSDYYMRISAGVLCPFDSNVSVIATGAFPPYTATCLSCVPQQTVSSPNAVFAHLDTGSYLIRVTDACGETRDKTVHVDFQSVLVKIKFTACNDMQVYAYSSLDSPILAGAIFTLYGPDSIPHTNTTGTFTDLPPGNYTVVVHTDGCKDNFGTAVLPYFDPYCIIPYMDSACQLKLLVKQSHRTVERYSLVSGIGTVYNEAPVGYFSVPPGSYNIVSDSGCSEARNLAFDFTFAETHTMNCIDQGSISLSQQFTSVNFCPGNPRYRYSLQNADTILTKLTNTASVTFGNLTPGTYVAKSYFTLDSTIAALFPTGNDTSCWVDSITIVLISHSVPIIHTQNVNVCGATTVGDIPFTISNGFPPYFVSIPGYASISTDSSHGTLYAVPVGNYTMIVNDSCGISSSRSVSVADTCHCLHGFARFTASDSVLCKGAVVSFRNIDSSSQFYRWTINDTLFSTALNPSLIISSAGNKLIRCIAGYGPCRDTFSLNILVFEPPVFNLGSDTLYCDHFTRILHSGIPATHWSTGVVDSFITVSSPGLYWCALTGICGTFSDSIDIKESITPHLNLGIDSSICAGDSITLSAYSDSATYLWGTGSTADKITVYQAGEYAVTVSISGCMASDSVGFQLIVINPDILIPDTTLCDGHRITLSPNFGTNPVWQDGSQNATYTVSSAGVYSVTVNSPCGNITDSVKIDFELCPSGIYVADAFTPNGDGRNDHFTVFGTSISEYEIRIYNRWGELVYRSQDPAELNDLSKGWDGSYKGKLQDVGVFVYYITAKGEDQKQFVKKGNITLIR